MIVPTFLIIPTAIVALVLYLWLYYERNPVNRVTDLRFLLALGCFGVIIAQLVVMVQRYDPKVPSLVLFLAALGLLIGAIMMRRRRLPPAFRHGQ